LIGVGDDNLLQVVIKNIGPGQNAAPGQHFFHHAVTRAIVKNDDLVANGDYVGEAGILGAESAAQAAHQGPAIKVYPAQAAADLNHNAALADDRLFWKGIPKVLLHFGLGQRRSQDNPAALALTARHDPLGLFNLKIVSIAEITGQPIFAAGRLGLVITFELLFYFLHLAALRLFFKSGFEGALPVFIVRFIGHGIVLL
jgi:hypothetical protein